MKKIFFLNLLLLITSCFYSQSAIKTKTPESSAILEVSSSVNKGVLIPRVQLLSTDNKHPLSGDIPNGTIVFNTANAGQGINAVIPNIYIWFVDRWMFPAIINKEPDLVAKFSNSSNNKTNFNPPNTSTFIEIPIFENQLINDNNDVFERINSTSIRIKKNGVYLIAANLALRQSPAVEESRLSDYIYFKVDNNLASSKIVTLAPQYNPSNVNINGRFAFGINSYANISAGQVLTLVSERYRNGSNYNGTLIFDESSLSSVTIIKID